MPTVSVPPRRRLCTVRFCTRHAGCCPRRLETASPAYPPPATDFAPAPPARRHRIIPNPPSAQLRPPTALSIVFGPGSARYWCARPTSGPSTRASLTGPLSWSLALHQTIPTREFHPSATALQHLYAVPLAAHWCESVVPWCNSNFDAHPHRRLRTRALARIPACLLTAPPITASACSTACGLLAA